MKKCEYCGEDIAIRNPTGKCDHLHYPENINKELLPKKVVLEGYMSKTAFPFIKFSEPSKYAFSNNQRKGLQVLTFPRIYNKLPRELQPTRPIKRVKIRVTIEEIKE